MPSPNRICRNFLLVGTNGRGSKWSLWITPKPSGPNDIYFAGSGFLRSQDNRYGFLFHLSFHKDGRAHIKCESQKIHRFSVSDPNNFPICSIYTHVDDLIVPMKNVEMGAGDNVPIDVIRIPNPNSFKWVELFFAHFETSNADRFIRDFSAPDFDFQLIERTLIGQGREILVAARFIQSTKTTGARPDTSDLERMDNTNRLTVWGYRCNQSKHIAVHDLSPNLDRINEVYNLK